jgi:2-methylisocitrate lyase-like PEP mutase family enzyme
MDAQRRRTVFRDLHREGCFVIPNPWDIGTARWLRAQGFKALATTSAGFAFTQGRADQDVGLDLMLGYIREIVAAVPDLPVNADFENAYADAPEHVARNVRLCADTGVAGLSVEDATGRADDPLYPEGLALERVIAAREALAGTGVVLTARAEGLLHGDPGGLDSVCRRIEAFARAGADCVFAPGIRDASSIRAVVQAAGGVPVNFLMAGSWGLTVADAARLGARRISIGAALARVAWSGFIEATRQIVEEGRFDRFAGNSVSAPLNPFFTQDLKDRTGS